MELRNERFREGWFSGGVRGELWHSSISGNRARGGQEGVGGGLYTLGTTTADKWTLRKIVGNSASTSDNDVSGIEGVD